LYMVMTRVIRTRDNPAATTFYSTAVGAVVLSIMVPFFWQDLTSFQWLLMVTMGTAGAIGHFLLVKAFHSAEASMLAPFTYSQVIGAIFWGFIVFGDVPSMWSTTGATLIIGSGIYVWYRETRTSKKNK
ncbi:MAG: DMT family transporter, partial [Rhodospirillaceae bacterium]|nr:DMT family transporter [Rhodospirillaceae bacterium]